MLNKRDETILKVINHYRYMTGIDVAYRLFSPGSKKHVIEILSGLSGNADHKPNEYLYRFGLPKATKGNIERIYTLGARGRNFLQEVSSNPVMWQYRQDRASYSLLVHSLTVTRFCVVAWWWSKNQERFKLLEDRTGYDEPPPDRNRTVIPDAWLLFKRSDGMRGSIILEIDRGTEFKEQFQKHIRSRLQYVQLGEFEKHFGEKSVICAYVSEGNHPRRLKAMQQWAMEVLREEKRENWASMFRFTQVELEKVYQTPLFDGAIWMVPNKDEQALLFGG
jgi:hypothetical protein